MGFILMQERAKPYTLHPTPYTLNPKPQTHSRVDHGPYSYAALLMVAQYLWLIRA